MNDPMGTKRRGPGQEQLREMLLPQHGLARYRRIRLDVTAGVLRWQHPRTLLGIVPFGRIRVELPLGDLESVHLQRPAFRALPLAGGLLLLAVPLFVIPWWIAVPLMVVGAWAALVSFGPQLVVLTRAGKRHRAAVCFGHQLDADLFVAAVEEFIDLRRAGGAGEASEHLRSV